jgi:hypothetical protein
MDRRQHERGGPQPLGQERAVRHLVGNVQPGFQRRHATGGCPQGYDHTDDQRRHRFRRRPAGRALHCLGKDRGRPGRQRLVQAIDQPVHRPGPEVQQAGQAEQGDQRREQGEEPVVGEASRGHGAAVADELLACALDRLAPAGLGALQLGSKMAGRLTLCRDALDALGRRRLGPVRLDHSHPPVRLVAFASGTLPRSVTRLEGSLRTGDVLEQVAQGEPVLVAVVAPRRGRYRQGCPARRRSRRAGCGSLRWRRSSGWAAWWSRAR